MKASMRMFLQTFVSEHSLFESAIFLLGCIWGRLRAKDLHAPCGTVHPSSAHSFQRCGLRPQQSVQGRKSTNMNLENQNKNHFQKLASLGHSTITLLSEMSGTIQSPAKHTKKPQTHPLTPWKPLMHRVAQEGLALGGMKPIQASPFAKTLCKKKPRAQRRREKALTKH